MQTDDWKSERIDRVSFRTRLELSTLAEKIGLSDVTEDYENVWEWVIGKLGNLELDICRKHDPARMKTDTYLFALDLSPLLPSTVETLVERLRPYAVGPIKCGRVTQDKGDDPELLLVHEFPEH